MAAAEEGRPGRGPARRAAASAGPSGALAAGAAAAVPAAPRTATGGAASALTAAATVAGLLCLLAGCVTVPSNEDPVVLKIGELESRLEALEARMESEGVVSLVSELQRLQEEVRELRGAVDVARNEVDRLASSQRTLFVQLDDRLTALETGGGARAPGAGGAGPMPRGAPAPGEQQQQQGLAAPLPDDELYDRGFELLKQQQYEQAGEVFAELVRTQPGSSLAGAAQYWYGETFYVRRRFEQARDAFRRVLQDYPRSSKAADAQLKLGFSYYELQEWGRARSTLQEVLAQHAGTPAAELAAERLDRMRREGR